MNTNKIMNTNKKTHKLASKKKFQVTFAFAGGKWNFRIGNFTLLTKVPGGKKNADKIAEILRKSWFRAGAIDGTARNAINRIVNADRGLLKDYRGKWDHNWSWADGGKSTMEILPPLEIRTEVTPTLPVVEAERDAVVAIVEQKAITATLAFVSPAEAVEFA